MDIINAPAADEYPLSYPTPTAPASLRSLAANTLVLGLWRHEGSLGSTSLSCEQNLSVPLPSCLRELIDKRIPWIGQQLNRLYKSFWLPGIVRTHCDFFKYFDSLTYTTEDEICAEKSATKFIKNVELTELEKFKIACVYWLVDDIRRIWPSVSERPELNDNSNPFLRYWVIEMRGRGPNDGQFNLNFTFSLMQKTSGCGNWTAVIEILNKLSLQDQFKGLTHFIRFHRPIKYLLPKLNRVQANYVLQNLPDEIISKLASQKECFADVLKIWNLVKESISARCLVQLLNYLCYGGYVCDPWGKCHEESAQVRLVLLLIWNTTPIEKKFEIFENIHLFNELKEFAWVSGFDSNERPVGYYNDMSIYKQLPQFFGERKRGSLYYPICFAHKMDFFFKLLEDIPPEMRAPVMINHWRGFVIRSRSEVLNRFLSLCLADEDEIRRFVEREMFVLSNIRSIIESWLKQKLYNEVIDYSNLCTWDMQLVEDFRRRVFLKMVPSLADLNCDKLIDLAADIDGNLSDVDIAKDIKRGIFLSDDVKIFFMSKLRKESTKEAINVIDCLLKTERSEHEKQLLLDLWFHFLVEGQNNEFDGRWEEFLSWWEGNKEDWPMFKQFLNLDEICIKLVQVAVPTLVSWLDPVETEESEIPPSKKIKLDEFSSIDDFLMWYFGTEAAVKNYKLEKISNYQTIPELKNIFRMYNEIIIDKVLEWFFDGDLAEVGNFKTNFKNTRK